MHRIVLAIIALAGFALYPAASLQAKDLKGWGIVVIHGKKGNPSRIADVASALRSAGAAVATPQMPWPNSYRPYEDVLATIDREVGSLRGRGATRIAVIGQSIGANVALGYAVAHPDLAAVVAIAPGHNPERFAGKTAESLSRARATVASGKGGDTGSYTDVNQGEVSRVKATATAYVSFFDPSGPAAAMTRNAEKLAGPKLLWIVGARDEGAQTIARGGKTITVKGGHKDTASAAKAQLVAWLSSL